MSGCDGIPRGLLIRGPTGAAAKLGIPRQTLESKIIKPGISRYKFRHCPRGSQIHDEHLQYQASGKSYPPRL